MEFLKLTISEDSRSIGISNTNIHKFDESIGILDTSIDISDTSIEVSNMSIPLQLGVSVQHI